MAATYRPSSAGEELRTAQPTHLVDIWPSTAWIACKLSHLVLSYCMHQWVPFELHGSPKLSVILLSVWACSCKCASAPVVAVVGMQLRDMQSVRQCAWLCRHCVLFAQREEASSDIIIYGWIGKLLVTEKKCVQLVVELCVCVCTSIWGMG